MPPRLREKVGKEVPQHPRMASTKKIQLGAKTLPFWLLRSWQTMTTQLLFFDPRSNISSATSTSCSAICTTLEHPTQHPSLEKTLVASTAQQASSLRATPTSQPPQAIASVGDLVRDRQRIFKPKIRTSKTQRAATATLRITPAIAKDSERALQIGQDHASTLIP